jgi:hypothetical protein
MQPRLEHVLPGLRWWAVLQLTDMEMRQYEVKYIHLSASRNCAKLTTSLSRADCAAGTCAGGLCEVDNPSSYSLDGRCGSGNGNKKCGGVWGDCCGDTNTCGTGSSFCGAGNCLYGNCTFTPPTSNPETTPLPFYYTGNTTDGFCGPNNDNKICNVAWGFCCTSTGKCIMEAQFCGTGCMPAYGNCTDAVIAPTPKPGDVSPGESRHQRFFIQRSC